MKEVLIPLSHVEAFDLRGDYPAQKELARKYFSDHHIIEPIKRGQLIAGLDTDRNQVNYFLRIKY